MEGLLQKMGDIIAQNFLLGALIAFGAGFLTVFTPCSLTSIPLIVNYMIGKEKTAKKAAAYSIFICLGQAIVFVALGMVAASLGRLIHNTGFDKAWHIILALLTLWMALEMLGVTNVLHRKTLPINKSAKKGILGALGVGMLTAVFASLLGSRFYRHAGSGRRLAYEDNIGRHTLAELFFGAQHTSCGGGQLHQFRAVFKPIPKVRSNRQSG